MKKHTRAFSICAVFVALALTAAGCSVGLSTDGAEETVDITLGLVMPDYAGHLPAVPDGTADTTDTAERASPKVIDPGTTNVQVTMTAEDGSPILDTAFTFSSDSDSGYGHWEWDNGWGRFDCYLPSVPLGENTTVTVRTFDAAGTELTSGTRTLDIDAFMTWFEVRLEPVNFTPIVLDNETYGTVTENEMKYYKFVPETGGKYLVTVHSEYQDVNLYLYRGSEVMKQSWYQSEPPVDEAIVFNHESYWWWDEKDDDTYYIGVYGGRIGSTVVSNVDLSAGVDLSTNSHIVIRTARDTVEVDLASAATTASAVTLAEIQTAIDNANIRDAWDEWNDGDYLYVTDDGAGHLVLESSSFVQVLPGTATDAFPIVWGTTAVDNSFSVKVTRFESESFEHLAEVDLDPTLTENQYSSIEGAPATRELWGLVKEYPFKEVNLGFTFYYNGTPYTKIYVSPNGYISFWKYRMYYSWWYWDYPSDFWYNAIDWENINNWYGSYWWNNTYLWGWRWFYEGVGEDLPNELVALFKAPFYFSTDPSTSDTSEIYYQKRTNGDGKNEFVIEYKNMYHRYDPQMSTFDRYLSGQIILTEGDNLAPVKDGTITLKYDRTATASNMSYIQGFVGLENNTGEEILGPGDIPVGDVDYDTNWPSGLPVNDIRFTPATGGLNFVVE